MTDDLRGQQFGFWTVLYRDPTRRCSAWWCRCQCGIVTSIPVSNLKGGRSTRCRECTLQAMIIDLTGRRYGRWEVLGLHHRPKGQPTQWVCRCDCGTIKVVSRSGLHNGDSNSCGCYASEVSRETGKTVLAPYAVKHGDAGGGKPAHEYHCWRSMKKRCNNPNATYYHNYGGRGITVCERWNNSYEDFLADMGRAPSPEHSLDRIDNDGNYEPGNVRWATPKEQAANTRPRPTKRGPYRRKETQ